MAFKIRENQGLVIVDCPDLLGEIETKELGILIKDLVTKTTKVLVLDFKTTQEIEKNFYRSLTQLKTNLNQEHKNLMSVHLSKKLYLQLQNDGMISVVPPLEGNKSFLKSS